MDKQAKVEGGVIRRDAWGLGFDGFNGSAARMAAWPLELWLQWQADMLKTLSPAMAEWMTRRREGTDSALHALRRLCSCDDPGEAAKIQDEWSRGVVKRLESDFRFFTDSLALWQQASARAAHRAPGTELQT